MRGILLAAILITGLPLCAQPSPTEAQTLSTLLTEVQRLRLAIERNTLLGARTQIVILQLQTQQGHVEKISRDLDEVRKEIARIGDQRGDLSSEVKGFEARLLDSSTPSNERAQVEQQIKRLKNMLEQPSARESQLRVREGELTGQLQSEQSRLAQLQNQMSEMDRALETAIRQVTGQ